MKKSSLVTRVSQNFRGIYRYTLSEEWNARYTHGGTKLKTEPAKGGRDEKF